MTDENEKSALDQPMLEDKPVEVKLAPVIEPAPEECKIIMEYIDSLEYWDAPDYKYITYSAKTYTCACTVRLHFSRLLDRVHTIKFNKTVEETMDDQYDWEKESVTPANTDK